MIVVRIFLIPFSLIYSILMFVRNKFYDKGIFKSYEISVPVISVGNISTGGTGKTPLVILIAKYFLSKGKRTGIISRGYKRKSDVTEIVYDGIEINSGIEHSGDELMQIYENLVTEYPGRFYIIATADRVSAAGIMIDKFSPDVIILDDGFQHRRLKRNLDLLLIDAPDYNKRKFLNSFTIPAGNLREGISNLRRADLIIQNNKSEEAVIIPILSDSGKPVCKMTYKTEFFMDFKNRILSENKSDVIAFSGIANDDSFIKMILQSGHAIKERINYPDHYEYRQSDIDNLSSKYKEGIFYITTEKDFVKLRTFRNFAENYPLFYLKLKTEISGNKELLYSKFNSLIN